MSPRHHPSDAMLAAYSAGTLGEGLSLVVATHLALCPQCRRQAAHLEEMGGALLEQTAPVALADQALETLLNCLDDTEDQSQTATRPAAAPSPLAAFPQPLRGYLEAGGPETGRRKAGLNRRWKRLAPGLHQIELLPRSYRTGAGVRLLKISPGTQLPHHGHNGRELTLVLEGSYCDELGRYAAGDVADLDDEVSHRPVVDTDVDCLCLVATEHPLRFSGLVPRLMQPFIGL